MKKVVIAFDCDGTLISNAQIKPGDKTFILPNERIRSMLIALASFKNTYIIVWSGSGEIWAHQVVRELGIAKYVDKIMAKNVLGDDANGHPVITADIMPDIAIDDIQACDLGKINLIVKEK